jgi:hypothetical protein
VDRITLAPCSIHFVVCVTTASAVRFWIARYEPGGEQSDERSDPDEINANDASFSFHDNHRCKKGTNEETGN